MTDGCSDPSEVPSMKHSKRPASVMILGVISCEGDVISPDMFQQGLRVNVDGYIDVLKTTVKPWMDKVSAGRSYLFQQDSFPAHKAKKTQAWLLENVLHQWNPDLCPSSSPDCNPLDYFLWGVVKMEVNKVAQQHGSVLEDVHHGDHG